MTYLLLILNVLVIVVCTVIHKVHKSRTWQPIAVAPARIDYDAAAYGLVPRDRLDPRRSGPPLAPQPPLRHRRRGAVPRRQLRVVGLLDR